MEVAKKKRGADKTALSADDKQAVLTKPAWIRAKAPSSPEVAKLTGILREHRLHTVCEEANCPNLGECFNRGTATFMIMGDVCTRRCPFCDVAHGRPSALDPGEPEHLAEAVRVMKLRYVVVTSVTRDDLADGGAGHFARCVEAIRRKPGKVKVEILVPDFRRCVQTALANLGNGLPDVFNHNLETVPRLYAESRPGADYQGSLKLLQCFKEMYPDVL